MTKLSFNAKLSKKINRELVLKTIYNNKPISRADIANITGLTPPSVTKIIDEFLNIGIVTEIGRNISNSGRKPISLDINSDRFYIIGIYVARKSISGIIANLNAEIIKKIRYDEECLEKPDIIERIVSLIKELLEISGVKRDKILGIGMAIPGPINAKKGEIINRELDKEKAYSWVRIPVAEKVSEILNIPVFADKCSNISAMGESWFGNGMKYSNFVLISFGEGLGAGLILKNRLYRGEDDIVGEIGHTTIDINGPKCECGNIGCLELFVQNKTIIERFNNLVKKYPDSKLGKINVEKVEDIYNFKDNKDPIFNEIINYLANFLSISSVNLTNILNPQAIIIATNELEDIELSLLVEKIKEIVRNRAHPVVRNNVNILASKLGSNIQLIGCISIVLRDFFNLDL